MSITGTSYDDINMKLDVKLHPLFVKEKAKLECIRIIVERFDNNKIKILDHIESITKVGYKYEQGFEFSPVDKDKWLKTLKASKKFVPDKKNNIVGCAASAVTDGMGIRELGKGKSLHCAVSSFKCSVHLDNTGFRIKGPNGPIYSLDGGQHLVYDLLWDDIVVRNAYNLSYELGQSLDRFRPTFLTSKNGFSQYGFGIDIYDTPNLKIKFDYTRSFDIGKSIGRGAKFYQEISRPKEQMGMLTLEARHNWLGG